ncbi:MAG: protein kinase [Bryobacterales bacterium]|nr:protein kinase [Bryobacterales bacterium]
MNVDPRWLRVQELCLQSEGLSPEMRHQFLIETEPDGELRGEVEALLEAMDDEAAIRAQAATCTNPVQTLTPEFLGPYRVLKLLGQGGTGTVFAAEKESDGVRVPVAVKLLHTYLAEGESMERFRREQRILASLRHPSITRLLDAGVTAEQRPYLVMEYVEGEPIDQYCNRLQLSPQARIGLIVGLCLAVAAAHRNLVVHLDLKPSNLLVTTDGEVKLLDFGTAKLMGDDGKLTTTLQLTPRYASPEQLRGEHLSTACDVFSMGVVLFELLTGSLPFRGEGSLLAAAERAAPDARPRSLLESLKEDAAQQRNTTPQRLRDYLRGDLEVVMARALASDAQQRYPTMDAFVDDLNRFVEGRPVLARPQTVLYRARKYVARHRGAVSATALLLLALATALGYGLWQQRQAAIAGREAQANAQFLGWMISSSNVMYGGRNDMTVGELVNRTYERLKQPSALSMRSILVLRSSLGLYMFTSGDAVRGLQVATEAMKDARENGDRESQLAVYNTVGLMESISGNCPQAIRVFEEAEQVYRLIARSIPPHQHAAYLTNYSQVAGLCQGDRDRELQLLSQAERYVRQIPDNSRETEVPAPVLKSLFYVGYSMALSRREQFAEARAALAEGIRISGEDNPDTRAARIALLRAEASIAYQQKDIDGAVAALRGASDAMAGFVSPFEYHRIRMMLANRVAESGRPAEATAVIDESLLALAALEDAQLGGPRWMVLVDAAFGEMRVGRCESVFRLVDEVDRVTSGNMPPQWKGNRLAAEALCRQQLGEQSTAIARAAESIQQLNAAGITHSTLISRLVAIRDGNATASSSGN